MLRVDDTIYEVGSAKYISTPDPTEGYWQVPECKEHHPKPAFATPFGLFQFCRMTFGLHGLPATFQRMVDQLLHGLHEFATYIDDIVIFSCSWEDYLTTKLMMIQEVGLKFKPKKCQFDMSECLCLVYVIGSGKVYPETQRPKLFMSLRCL